MICKHIGILLLPINIWKSMLVVTVLVHTYNISAFWEQKIAVSFFCFDSDAMSSQFYIKQPIIYIGNTISENSEVHKSATLQQNGPSGHSSAWLWPWKWYEHEAEYVHFSKPRRSRRENVFISSKAAFCWKLAFLCLFAWKNDDVVKELCWKVKSQLWCRCNLSIMPKAIQHVIAQFFNYWL